MLKHFLRFPLCFLPCFAACAADIVWDPTEIARLAEQAAQISLQYSALIDLQQTLGGLSTGLGPMGARGSDGAMGMAALASLRALAPPLPLPDQAALASRLPSTGRSAAQQNDNQVFWQQAARNAAADGIALSSVLRQGLASAMPQVQRVLSQAGSAPDLRGDVAANSAICLLVFADLAAVEAALAVSLQEQTAATLWKMTE